MTSESPPCRVCVTGLTHGLLQAWRGRATPRVELPRCRLKESKRSRQPPVEKWPSRRPLEAARKPWQFDWHASVWALPFVEADAMQAKPRGSSIQGYVWGLPIIRTIVSLGLYLGPPIWAHYHMVSGGLVRRSSSHLVNRLAALWGWAQSKPVTLNPPLP